MISLGEGDPLKLAPKLETVAPVQRHKRKDRLETQYITITNKPTGMKCYFTLELYTRQLKGRII